MIRALAVTVAALIVATVPAPGGDGPARPAAQDVLSRQVPVATAHARPAPVGAALAIMRIPRFGPGWEWTALEGTAPAVIADGPGHYRGTALPGEPGNSAWAAHRAGHGDPFIDFDRLRPGDRVVLRQGRARWVYVVTTRPRIVDVRDGWVIAPTVGRRLTLTTCWPRYGSARRMYVRATLRR